MAPSQTPASGSASPPAHCPGRHVVEQADGLKGAADAQAGNTVRAPAGDVMASEDQTGHSWADTAP